MTPGLERSLRRGHDNPLQYSCLENPHEQRSLAGYSPWDLKELDMTERLSMFFFILFLHAYFMFFLLSIGTCLRTVTSFTPLQVLNKLLRMCLYQHNPRHFIIWGGAAVSQRAQGMLELANLWV